MGKKKKSKRAAKSERAAQKRGAESAEPEIPAYDLAGALAAAGWAEADESLAEALTGFSELESSVKMFAQDARGLRRRADHIEERLVLLRQSLDQIARARGLRRFGEAGAREDFDSARHQLTGSASDAAPAQVRVLVPGVARGAADAPQILIRALVEADAAKPAKKKSKLAKSKAGRAE